MISILLLILIKGSWCPATSLLDTQICKCMVIKCHLHITCMFESMVHAGQRYIYEHQEFYVHINCKRYTSQISHDLKHN